jgi:hypothetical protein
MNHARIVLIIYGRHVIQERIGIVISGLSRRPLQAPPARATSHYAPGLTLGTPLMKGRPCKHQVFNLNSVLIVFYDYLRGDTLLP